MRTAKPASLLLAVVWMWNSLIGAGILGQRSDAALAQNRAPSQSWEQARGLAVAGDAQGTLWAAWEMDNGRDTEVYAAQWSGGAWSDATAAARRPEAWDSAPSLTVAADGTPWLAWSSTLRSSPDTTRIYASRWTGDRWSPPEALPVGDAFGICDGCGWGMAPVLAASPDGTVWTAWVGADGREENIFAQRWNGGVWSLPRQVSASDGSPLLYERQPRLAVGSDGRPWVAWTANQANTDGTPIPGDDEIYASRWTGATWSPEEMVSRDDDLLDTSPALAVDGEGQAWLAWQARVTEDGVSRLRIVASRWDAARQAWTVESVASSPLAADVDEVHPSLAADGEGSMQATWVALGRGEASIGYARRLETGWVAPLLVAAGPASGISAHGEAKLVVGEGGPGVAWLDPLARESLPVRRFEVPLGEENSLANWLASAEEVTGVQEVTVDAYPYRFLAFGDSITLGAYPLDDPVRAPFYPYPSILQDTLRFRANPQYNVVNGGENGERTASGAERVKVLVREYRPHYVLFMEGTNNVTHDVPPAEVYENIKLAIVNATRNAEVVGVLFMLATIIPRKDSAAKLEQTRLMNELAIIPVARDRRVPLADQWQAFMDYGDWPSIMWDDKHPNQAGMQLISDTFYAKVLDVWSGSVLEDTVPPTTWMEPLPPASPCSGVTAGWNGTDGLSWVVNYDVQVQTNFGVWTDWLLSTTDLSALYIGGREGDQLGFRVRGRDVAGNVSDYSAPAYTAVTDDQAPEAQMLPLSAAQKVPFTVSWQGSDGCGSIAAYHVQYRTGSSVTWTDWLPSTLNTSATFNPSAPAYGQAVYFRVQARDEAGNWSAWSPEVSTLLARYTLSGQVLNVRHGAVSGAIESTNPAALIILSQGFGRFTAYLADGGTYQVTAQHDLYFGSLPPMVGVLVNEDVSGLLFILPPKDDAASNGGFESGGLAGWTLGGTSLPAPSTLAHTGLGAALLDGSGGSSSLRQVMAPATAMSQATLSFLARLEQPGAASMLQIVVAREGSPNPPVTHEVSVTSTDWSHIWYDVGDLQGEPLAVTLISSGGPAIVIDEVSLGTAVTGGSLLYLPMAVK